MSGLIIDKIKSVLDEFETVCLDIESDRELLDDLKNDERGL